MIMTSKKKTVAKSTNDLDDRFAVTLRKLAEFEISLEDQLRSDGRRRAWSYHEALAAATIISGCIEISLQVFNHVPGTYVEQGAVRAMRCWLDGLDIQAILSGKAMEQFLNMASSP
jgi:hypothetical protein